LLAYLFEHIASSFNHAHEELMITIKPACSSFHILLFNKQSHRNQHQQQRKTQQFRKMHLTFVLAALMAAVSAAPAALPQVEDQELAQQCLGDQAIIRKEWYVALSDSAFR
jgi:hypothetical protein